MLLVSIYALLLFPEAILGTPDGCERFANSDSPNQSVLPTEANIIPSDLSVKVCTSTCQDGGFNAAGVMEGAFCCTYFTSSLW